MSALNKRRLDGRSAFEVRPVYATYSRAPNANGSATFYQGFTGATAVIIGPKAAANNNKMLLDSAYIEISVRPRAGAAGNTEKSLEVALLKCAQSCVELKAYPRSVIRLVIQTVANDGSVGSAAVNAMVMALLDAGIQMRFTPFAVTIGVLRRANEIEHSTSILDNAIMQKDESSQFLESSTLDYHEDSKGNTMLRKDQFYLDPTSIEGREKCESVVCFVFNFRTGGFICSFTDRGSGVLANRASIYTLAYTAVEAMGNKLAMLWQNNMRKMLLLFETNNSQD